MKSRQKIFALFCAIISVILCIFSCKDAPVEEQPDNTPKNAVYKVLHYKQKLPENNSSEAKYDLAETEELSGLIGKPTAAAAKSYAGFTAQEISQKLITADGKTEVSVYYNRNEVTLKIDRANGSSVETIKGLYGAAVNVANPVKANSTFSGWKPALPSTFPAASVQTAYVAQWNKITANYTVKHLQQNVSGSGYTEVASETKSGYAGDNTAAAAKSYTGFTAKSVTQKAIAADGSTVVEILYDRNKITLTLNLDGGTTATALTNGKLTGLYGAAFSVAAPTKPGWIFIGWNKEGGTWPETFTSDGSYTALYAENAANYTVRHYQQNVSGNGYTEVTDDCETKSGIVGNNTAAVAKSYEGFTAQTVTQKTIAADGKTEVSVYYNRNEVTLKIDRANGTSVETIKGLYGAAVNVPTDPVREYYTFEGWNAKGGTIPEVFPAADAEYTAVWKRIIANYTVKHLQQDVNGSEYAEVTADLETKSGNAGDITATVEKSYEGFTAQPVTQKTIATDGSTVVEIKYDRKLISLTINLNGGTTTTTLTNGKLTGLYGAEVSIVEPEREDYTFSGWSPALPGVFPAESPETVYKALWFSDSKTETGISVTLGDNPDINITDVVQEAGKVTFTAESGLANYKWYVNGKSGVQGTERTFVLDTTGLSEDCYTVTVRAEKSGFPLSSSAYVELDKTAPARVSGLAVTAVDVSSNKVSLEWTNPSDSDFKNVKVYWTESDGVHSQEVSGTKGAAASTDITVADARNSYEFKVRSVDEYGNESSSKYVTAKMVMKVVSDGNYDLSSAKRWNTSIGGFNVADVGKTFSFKLKFVNDGVYQFNGASGTIYVRTDQEKFIYWSSGTGSMSALSGEWAGWYEITGTITSSSNTTFAVVMNGDDVSGTNKFSNAALYIADFKFGTEGAMNTVNNSNLSVGRYDSNITPVKSFVTLGNAN